MSAADTLTAQQLVESSFKEYEGSFAVEISPTGSMQRLRGINPELNKSGFRYCDHESAVELYYRSGVPHARVNYALMFRGEPLELNGSAVTAVNVKGNWGRPLGRRQMTMRASQFFAGRKCSCGNTGRALFDDGTTLCRKCLPAELDERLTPAVRAARIIDAATPSGSDSRTATDLVIYAAHKVITEHGFLSPGDAQASGRESTKALVDQLCRELLQGKTRPDGELMSRAPFLRYEALELAKASPDRDHNSAVCNLERDALTNSGAGQAVWAYAKLLSRKALASLTARRCDPGHLGIPESQIFIEVWVDRIEGSSIYSLSDHGHLLRFSRPAGAELEADGRYRIGATVAGYTSQQGISLTDLRDAEILEDLCAAA